MLLHAFISIIRRMFSARGENAAKRNRTPPIRRETAICQMIEIRRLKDVRLHHRKRPSNWPMFELWVTIEAGILDTVEQYLWLCDGGLVEQAALEKIEAFQYGNVDFAFKPGATIHTYIAHRLATVDPDYLSLGSTILNDVIQVAEKWSSEEIRRVKTENPFSPVDWLGERVEVSALEYSEGLPQTQGTQDLRRMKLRMLPTDELRSFSSSTKSWQRLAGRSGIALVRNGRPIGHVITLMN